MLGPRLLPDRSSDTQPPDLSGYAGTVAEHYDITDGFYRLRVRELSPLIGLAPGEVDLARYPGVTLIGVQARGSEPAVVHDRLDPDDVLSVTGPSEEVSRLAIDNVLAVAMRPVTLETGELVSRELGVVELVVPPRSPLVGETVFPGMARGPELVILGVRRLGEERGARSTTLQEGDALLVHGSWSAVDQLVEHRDVLVVNSPDLVRRQAVPLGSKAPRAIGVLVVMIALLALGVVPPAIAGLGAAVAMVLLGVIGSAQALRAVSWQTVVLIGGLIPLSVAIQQSGAADLLADGAPRRDRCRATRCSCSSRVFALTGDAGAVHLQHRDRAHRAARRGRGGHRVGGLAAARAHGARRRRCGLVPHPGRDAGQHDGHGAGRLPLRRLLAARAAAAAGVARRWRSSSSPSSGRSERDPQGSAALWGSQREGDDERGRARLRLHLDVSAVALHHDPSRDVEAETGALADLLGREEGLERALGDLGRHARPGVGDLHDDAGVVGARAHGQHALPVHRVDGVVDEVGPHLVELADVRLDRRHARGVLAPHLDPVAELVRQHGDGAVETLGHVGGLQGATVHLRVDLDRRHELGDPSRRLPHLAEQTADGDGAGHPLDPVLHGVDAEQLQRGVAPLHVGAGGGQRRGDDPVAFEAAAHHPRAQLVLAVRERQGVRGDLTLQQLTAQLVETGVLVRGDAVRRQGEQRRQRVLELSLERLDGAGGGRRRVVELVGQPGRQGAQLHEALALPHPCLDVAHGGEHPGHQVPHERDVGEQVAQRRVGHLEQPTRGARPTRWRSTTRARPRRRTRRPSGPRSANWPTTVSSPPATRSMSIRPDMLTHQHSAGAPACQSTSPGSNSTTSLTASRRSSCSSVIPSKSGDGADLVEEHQIVARYWCTR